jgi:hypothetical protein
MSKNTVRRTGNDMVIIGADVIWQGKPMRDLSELGAFDTKGRCVGTDVFWHGTIAFTIWGDNEVTPENDGMENGEQFTLKLWVIDDIVEYDYVPAGITRSALVFETDKMLEFSDSVGIRRDAEHAMRPMRLSVSATPFTTGTTIMFTVEKPGNGNAAITIRNWAGRVIWQRTEAVPTVGTYSIPWTGTDGDGREVSAGVYFIDAVISDQRQTLSVLKIK